MGMFDTIHVVQPLICPACGAEVGSIQTKEFDCTLAELKVGTVLSGRSVHSGIIKDRLHCSACWKQRRESGDQSAPPPDPPVYLVVWHTILSGVEQDLAKAEARLAAVDRLDLIGWLAEAQREAYCSQRDFWGFYNDVSRWHEHLARAAEPEPTGEDAERTRAFRRFFDLPEEILNAPDPLAAILAKHKPTPEEPGE